MTAYTTPLVRAVSLEAATLACNAEGRNTSSQCREGIQNCIQVGGVAITIDPTRPIDTSPILTNTILGVDNSGVRVQPFANTGIPGSDPVSVGIPVGVHGVVLDVTATRGHYAIDPNGLGVDVAGQTILIGLP